MCFGSPLQQGKLQTFGLCYGARAPRVTIHRSRPMKDHLRTGAEGEQLACRWLQDRGYRILHRNWRHGRQEVDIVARDGRFLVVVEVKTRGSGRWGDPELAVGPAKRRQLGLAAEELVHSVEGDLELRFDVIGITHTPAGPEILHIPDAFYPTL